MDRLFAKGFIPSAKTMPAEKTHARTKLIYSLLRVLVQVKPKMQAAALAEVQKANSILYDRVKEYLGKLTPEEIVFFIGPRPTHHPDGTLAIYDPIKDNPLLMAVYHGEKPEDASGLWKPSEAPGHELTELRQGNRIIVGRN